MSMLPILKQMSTLFLLVLTGYCAKCCGVLGQDAQKWLSKLLINITCPALILSSVTTGQRLEDNRLLALCLGTAVVYFLVLPAVARVCALVAAPQRRSEFAFMLIYPNMGFMGIPVANAVLGKESILYISIFMAVFNISMFSYGAMLLGGKSGEKLQFKRMLNPNIVAAVAGICLYLAGLSLPGLLLDPITSLGNTTTPLAMLVIGASLANSRLGEMFREKSMLPFTLLRLLVLPLCVWAVCRLCIPEKLLASVAVLLTGMPVASNAVMLSSELNRDVDYIAKGVFFSTLFSVVTIPLIAMIL